MMAQRSSARKVSDLPPLDDLIRPAVAAELVDVTVGTLRDWSRLGKIRTYRLVGGVRYSRTELQALVRDVTYGGAA